MRRSLLMAIGFTAVTTTATTFGQDANLERGKYLVEESRSVPGMPHAAQPRPVSSTGRSG